MDLYQEMPKERTQVFFVRDAKTTRVREGLQIKAMENQSGLSRSSINRIEGDTGVSETTAYRYIKALKALVPDYPHDEPSSKPAGGKSAQVHVFRSHLKDE